MGEKKIKNATSAGMLRWCHERPKKVVPESEKRSCQYMMLTLLNLIITLKVVPLYDVNPSSSVDGWPADRYFRLNRTAEMEKLDIVLMSMEGPAL